MELVKMKKLVIITEALVQDKIVETIKELGCKGYTVQRATGQGESGMRSSIVDEHFNNIRMEIIADEEAVEKWASEVVRKFFEHYAGIVYMQDVDVIRKKKFHTSE